MFVHRSRFGSMCANPVMVGFLCIDAAAEDHHGMIGFDGGAGAGAAEVEVEAADGGAEETMEEDGNEEDG